MSKREPSDRVQSIMTAMDHHEALCKKQRAPLKPLYVKQISRLLYDIGLDWTTDFVKLDKDVGKELARHHVDKDYSNIDDKEKARSANREVFVKHELDGDNEGRWSRPHWDLAIEKQAKLF